LEKDMEQYKIKTLIVILRDDFKEVYKKYIEKNDIKVIINKLTEICEKIEYRGESVYYFKGKWCAKFTDNEFIDVFIADSIDKFDEILAVNNNPHQSFECF
jgi:hypothetical protein